MNSSHHVERRPLRGRARGRFAQASRGHRGFGGITFEIQAGEVFGLLGPNGAGKTTTLEILEGLRRTDGGTVMVCGLEPGREQTALKERIGAQLQATVLPDKIRVEEALALFSSFYLQSASLEMLLEQFGLAEKRRAVF